MKRLLLTLALTLTIPGAWFLAREAARADGPDKKAKQPSDAPVKPVVVPFTLSDQNHILVQLKVNGKGPYKMIFDTGAPLVWLSPNVGGEAKVKKTVGKDGIAETFSLGELDAADMPVWLENHPACAPLGAKGIIGFNFYGRYKMTVDYKAKQMTFEPNGFEPPPDRGNEVPACVRSSGQWGMVIAAAAVGDQETVTVQEVLSGSAAAAAGIQAGDQLLLVDGCWADSVNACYVAVGRVKPGTAARVLLRRGEKEVEVTVTPRRGL